MSVQQIGECEECMKMRLCCGHSISFQMTVLNNDVNSVHVRTILYGSFSLAQYACTVEISVEWNNVNVNGLLYNTLQNGKTW